MYIEINRGTKLVEYLFLMPHSILQNLAMSPIELEIADEC